MDINEHVKRRSAQFLEECQAINLDSLRELTEADLEVVLRFNAAGIRRSGRMLTHYLKDIENLAVFEIEMTEPHIDRDEARVAAKHVTREIFATMSGTLQQLPEMWGEYLPRLREIIGETDGDIVDMIDQALALRDAQAS